MPELNGWETTRLIRKNENRSIREIPIIAVTADAMQGDRELCIETGMNDYLAKPILKEELTELLSRWLP